jgi:hypothetical protein
MEANDNPLIWQVRYRFIPAAAGYDQIEEMVIDAPNIDVALIEAHLSLSESETAYKIYSVWTEGEPALSDGQDWETGCAAHFARKRREEDPKTAPD